MHAMQSRQPPALANLRANIAPPLPCFPSVHIAAEIGTETEKHERYPSLIPHSHSGAIMPQLDPIGILAHSGAHH